MPLIVPSLDDKDEVVDWSGQLTEVLRLNLNKLDIQKVTQKKIYVVPTYSVSSMPDPTTGPFVIFVTSATGGNFFAASVSGIFRRFSWGSAIG